MLCVCRCVENNNRRISREWRQKIESWLQANEQDEKQADDHKRRARRLTGNRRSFENDSGEKRVISILLTSKKFPSYFDY